MIFLSFADVKFSEFSYTKKTINSILAEAFRSRTEMLKDEIFSDEDRELFSKVCADMDISVASRSLKTNPYLERGIMTGITRISKESIFSDLNNLNVVTTTSDEYATAFGFTEYEVFAAMDAQGFSEEEKSRVKFWYDGFTFGNTPDIYNPWSVTSYLDDKNIAACAF